MCQTVNMTMANQYCLWASCGEWCLTKTSGFCPQMHATVRRNGTDIRLENCTRITETECKQVMTINQCWKRVKVSMRRTPLTEAKYAFFYPIYLRSTFNPFNSFDIHRIHSKWFRWDRRHWPTNSTATMAPNVPL